MIGALVLAALASDVGQPASSSEPTTVPEMWGAWCARCHADNGSGKVAEPTITVEPMDFTDCRVATAEPDADWQLAIVEGGPAVGLSSEMPAFGDALTARQVRGFVSHIRTMCGDTGWPHGNLNFPRPIFTEKAFPENELVILPRITRRTVETPAGDRSLTNVDLVSIFERRFRRRAMWEIAVPIASHDRTGASRQQGVGDLELAVKYVLASTSGGLLGTVERSRHAILSSGLEVTFPTGSESRALGTGTVVFEPFLAAGALLFDWYWQAESKVELPADTARSDRAFVYNVSISRDTSAAPTTWTLGMELNGENRELAVTPHVRKGLTRTGALGAAFGVRIPINERREQGTAWVGYLLWEYLEPVRARP
jgi:mono/diheme cytochrome c family protein